MLQYVFAASSLKQRVDEGLGDPDGDGSLAQDAAGDQPAGDAPPRARPEPVDGGWCGAAPRRPNFPMPAYAYPAGVRIELVPFGEARSAISRSSNDPKAWTSRTPRFEAIAQATALPHAEPDGIVPSLQEFRLDRPALSVDPGRLRVMARRVGPEQLFVRPPNAQATEEHFRWPELVAVTDLDSARQAIDTIVEQGEELAGNGATPISVGCWASSMSTGAQGRRPVLRARATGHRRQRAAAADRCRRAPDQRSGHDPRDGSAECRLRSGAAAALALLRPPDESPAQLSVLADVSVGLMYTAIKPLASVVTTLPVGPDNPGVTAGPGFQALLPGRLPAAAQAAAWVLMEERLRDAAAFAVRCGQSCTPALMEPWRRWRVPSSGMPTSSGTPA